MAGKKRDYEDWRDEALPTVLKRYKNEHLSEEEIEEVMRRLWNMFDADSEKKSGAGEKKSGAGEKKSGAKKSGAGAKKSGAGAGGKKSGVVKSLPRYDVSGDGACFYRSIINFCVYHGKVEWLRCLLQQLSSPGSSAGETAAVTVALRILDDPSLRNQIEPRSRRGAVWGFSSVVTDDLGDDAETEVMMGVRAALASYTRAERSTHMFAYTALVEAGNARDVILENLGDDERQCFGSAQKVRRAASRRGDPPGTVDTAALRAYLDCMATKISVQAVFASQNEVSSVMQALAACGVTLRIVKKLPREDVQGDAVVYISHVNDNHYHFYDVVNHE
jgi:hypothetical protein